MRLMFHWIANRTASLLVRLLMLCVARIHVVHGSIPGQTGAFLLAANHISHFDPPILSSVTRRKIDWMAMAEFFPHPILGRFLRAVDAFPADRHRADRATIRTAIQRLHGGAIVGIFPEGGIRDGAASVLEGAPLRPGASTLAHLAGVPIVPCVILGTDRFYCWKSWFPLRGTPVWIAFGNPIALHPGMEKSAARERIEHDLAAAFRGLSRQLIEKFSLSADDLPKPPSLRMLE